MSEALVRRQLNRQAALQQRVILPSGGRVVSKEEGRAMSKKQVEENNIIAGAADSAAPSTVFLENEVSKKIVTLRQRQNERGNLKAHMDAFREDLKVAKLVDTTDVRAAATKLYAKNHTNYSAQRKERARRAVEGPVKHSKKKSAKK
ncbi:Hypothetical protein, putative [Bodo saltans]|uniref:Uncharacterized protein n=1 Tax=Bodo saltans TaxID=75058 RepID=A0A0S4JH37_BODSA|nr:Hypothetical protein, putative [Bodo saltans]|eukprot:CUG90854.1 Hypothetical protein, putative [Bodo saltans]